MGEARRRRGRPNPDHLTVAVVIPTIPGRERLFERAMASVRAQTRKPDQVIVERDTNRTGAAQARNRALERVDADVIAWLDDDDEMLPRHLQACMRVLELDRSLDLVYPTPVIIGGKDPTATSFQGNWTLPWGIRFGPEQEAHLRRNGSFIPMTHLVRMKAVQAAGGFPEGRVLDTGRYQGEDEAYLIRLLDTGARFGHLDAKTWKWHVHYGNTGGRGDG